MQESSPRGQFQHCASTRGACAILNEEKGQLNVKWKRNRSSHDLKMADRDSVRTSQEKDLRYNVEVAKRMTVPDEIRLTGPSRAAVDSSKPSSSSNQSNYHLPTQQLAPTAPDLETNQDRAPLDKNE